MTCPTCRKATVPQLLAVVADVFGVAPEDLTGDSLERRHVRPRQAAMAILRTDTRMVRTEIAAIFGRADVEGVTKAESRTAALLQLDPAFADQVAAVRAQVGVCGGICTCGRVRVTSRAKKDPRAASAAKQFQEWTPSAGDVEAMLDRAIANETAMPWERRAVRA